MNVIKRDGRLIDYDKSKISDAILKAMNHTVKGQDIELAKRIAQEITDGIKETVSVEDIQDLVEKKLMASKRKDVAKEYIIYRDKRNIARGRKQYDIYMDIVNAVPNDVTRENANMNADTPAGMMMKFASESSKPFVDDCLLSEQSKSFVKNNYIHIHDKDYYPTKSLTCLHHPLDYILKNGFRAGHGSSRPAKRIETASIIGCISMEQIQNEMHGGQSIPAFDFYLAPFVRLTYKEEVQKIEELLDIDLKDLYDAEIEDYIDKPLNGLKDNERYVQESINNTARRVHQSMEAFIHNMNTIHSRGGNQVVFSSINYGTDTSPEGRCIIREVMKSTYEGVGNGETPIFPIHIWKKKRGVNYLSKDRNYDLYKFSCQVTARRFFPNYLNLDATYNVHEDWDEKDQRRF
jgi:ribonucleoside-triphosphate reductase